MNVSFRDLDSYLSELESVDRMRVTVPVIVRVDKTEVLLNETDSLIQLVSGFCDEFCFYELAVECGKDYSGGRLREGSEAFEKLSQQIQSKCAELNVPCRGGVWQK